MTGRLPQWRAYGKWEYTSSASAREEAIFETMEEYIRIRQNTVTQFIATRSLLYLCEATYRTSGERVGMRWWEKTVIHLKGARGKASTEVDAYGTEK